MVRDAGDPSVVEKFLSDWPTGRYASAARALLATLRPPFTVTTVPPNARVRLLDVAEDYRPGMALRPGDYRLRVSAPGYTTVARTVAHSAGTGPLRIELRRRGAGDVFRDCAQCPEMVVVPAGAFRMGCASDDCDDDEKPAHDVAIRGDFALGRYEVTVGEFRSFVEATGYRTDAEKDAGRGCRTVEIMDRTEWGSTPGRNWRNLEYPVRDAQPVTCVSWNDAKAYARWLARETGAAYRLSSEAEWEYAVRAGSSRTRYYFGDAAERLCDYGNVADQTPLPNGSRWTNRAECSDGAVYPATVGSYRPNVFGLYDMHGNVLEWTEDCWNGSYAGAPSDGSAWLLRDCAKRVLRGGSWVDDPRLLRAAKRYKSASGNRDLIIGFRVARTLAP